jgi:integrase
VGELEVLRLLETAEGGRDRVLLALLYAAGLWVSEACGLLWRSVRPRGDSGQITVFGKNGRTRSIALNRGIWEQSIALRGTAGPEVPVFPSHTGRRLDRARVRVILPASRKTRWSIGTGQSALAAEWQRCITITIALALGSLTRVDMAMSHQSMAVLRVASDNVVRAVADNPVSSLASDRAAVF